MIGRWGRHYLRLLQTYTLPTQICTTGKSHLHTYNSALHTLTLLTLFFLAVIFPIGDSISQHLIDKKPWKEHNVKLTKKLFLPVKTKYSRTLRSITYGGLAWAPMGKSQLDTLAYKNNRNKVLNKISYPSSMLKSKHPLVGPGRRQTDTDEYVTAVICRVGIDMAIFTSFATCYYFVCMGLLEGRSWAEIKARIQQNYRTVVCTNMGIFGPAQIINMRREVTKFVNVQHSVIPIYGRPPFLNLVSLGYNCFLATLNSKTPALLVDRADTSLIATLNNSPALVHPENLVVVANS
ncbi:hypothetical protein VP01_492g3 [Puccinia sorghi]|uniref:Uncharacterized protein n=1 Tax=Puccinia sorghi TaxID=27349 RepID=A0A0L6UM11_9BASI|nr:hypothetical protein VP01_492g3 [Puccinia sorghi]